MDRIQAAIARARAERQGKIGKMSAENAEEPDLDAAESVIAEYRSETQNWTLVGVDNSSQKATEAENGLKHTLEADFSSEKGAGQQDEAEEFQ